jgi:hypothetical protein
MAREYLDVEIPLNLKEGGIVGSGPGHDAQIILHGIDALRDQANRLRPEDGYLRRRGTTGVQPLHRAGSSRHPVDVLSPAVQRRGASVVVFASWGSLRQLTPREWSRRHRFYTHLV